MFFASKIRATAEALGVNLVFASSLNSLLEKTRAEKAQLVLVDLHNPKVDAVELARQFKTDIQLRDVKLLGFFSHVQTDLQREAIEAGFDDVIPRSVFARDLPKLLSASEK